MYLVLTIPQLLIWLAILPQSHLNPTIVPAVQCFVKRKMGANWWVCKFTFICVFLHENSTYPRSPHRSCSGAPMDTEASAWSTYDSRLSPILPYDLPSPALVHRDGSSCTRHIVFRPMPKMLLSDNYTAVRLLFKTVGSWGRLLYHCFIASRGSLLADTAS